MLAVETLMEFPEARGRCSLTRQTRPQFGRAARERAVVGIGRVEHDHLRLGCTKMPLVRDHLRGRGTGVEHADGVGGMTSITKLANQIVRGRALNHSDQDQAPECRAGDDEDGTGHVRRSRFDPGHILERNGGRLTFVLTLDRITDYPRFVAGLFSAVSQSHPDEIMARDLPGFDRRSGMTADREHEQGNKKCRHDEAAPHGSPPEQIGGS